MEHTPWEANSTLNYLKNFLQVGKAAPHRLTDQKIFDSRKLILHNGNLWEDNYVETLIPERSANSDVLNHIRVHISGQCRLVEEVANDNTNFCRPTPNDFRPVPFMFHVGSHTHMGDICAWWLCCRGESLPLRTSREYRDSNCLTIPWEHLSLKFRPETMTVRSKALTKLDLARAQTWPLRGSVTSNLATKLLLPDRLSSFITRVSGERVPWFPIYGIRAPFISVLCPTAESIHAWMRPCWTCVECDDIAQFCNALHPSLQCTHTALYPFSKSTN
jgi:hypothetical protein